MSENERGRELDLVRRVTLSCRAGGKLNTVLRAVELAREGTIVAVAVDGGEFAVVHEPHTFGPGCPTCQMPPDGSCAMVLLEPEKLQPEVSRPLEFDLTEIDAAFNPPETERPGPAIQLPPWRGEQWRRERRR